MKKDFSGKVVLVTGASSGIGRASAVAFAREGADVAVLGRDETRLRDTEKACASYGVRTLAIAADSRDEGEMARAFQKVVETLGRVDVAHLNAGIYLRRRAEDLTIKELRAIMETNYFGTLNALYPALRHMTARGSGSIVVTVSMDGKKGVPPDAAYVASKFALNGYLQVLRQEMRASGVHVGAVFPSRTDTPQIAHVACPGITPKASAESVAEAVLLCVRKKKREVLTPRFSCRLLVLADAVSPALGDFLVRSLHLGGEQTGEAIVKN